LGKWREKVNKCEKCIGCNYNKTKKVGGYGFICNGSPMINYGRCPEWRINEMIRKYGSYDIRDRFKS